MVYLKRISIGLAVTALALLLTFYFLEKEDPAPPVERAAADAAPVKAVSREKVQTPLPEPAPAPAPAVPEPETPRSRPEWRGRAPEPVGIDPVRRAEAELALVNNQLYEDVARETLPTLSIQTHNPVWALEYDMQPGVDAHPRETDGASGPLPAPQSGPFGNIQPAAGEIWLRIPPAYADTHRDIMAENADLYRAETGYSDPVTITLWVGGRVYARQQYQ